MSRFASIPAAATAALLLLGSAVLPSAAIARELTGADDERSARAAMGTVSADWMQSTYYSCNPRPHSEKAYQKGDASPPLAPVATTVGSSGRIVVLVTTIYNRNPQGSASFGVMSADGTELRSGSTSMPGVVTLDGFKEGQRVFIQPRTLGTMAKILTPEQIAACGVSMPAGV
jgi:hypothetical protein